MDEHQSFNRKLACECARAFATTTKLGCTVSDTDGTVVYAVGWACASCPICGAAGIPRARCIETQQFGMVEAERFGGKYVYFCAMGLTCFVSPIIGQEGNCAKITAGPFLMVDEQDYVLYDLTECMHLSVEQIAAVRQHIPSVPFVAPEQVNDLSTLLFMAVGFMNNVSDASRMVDKQISGEQQGQISSYILQLKGKQTPPPYPFDTEAALLRSLSNADLPQAQKLLNEMLGFILFSSGGDFSRVKSHVSELMVLISRTAIDCGADPEQTLQLSHECLQTIARFPNIEALCAWLSGMMKKTMDSIFRFSDVRYSHLIHKALQYMRTHYAEKITLEDVAHSIYVSPAHFSRIFRQATGTTFVVFLNRIRIDNSKNLLQSSTRHVADIALSTGFEDQSYFTKVFKRMTGMSPMQYRNAEPARRY